MEVLRINDMFLLGMTDEAIDRAIEGEDYPTLSRHLYRVQKLSSMYYVFRDHLETEVKDEKKAGGKDEKEEEVKIPKFYRVQSMKAYEKLNPRKVKIDLLGRISLA